MADLTTIEQRIDDLYTEVSNDEQSLDAHETAANVDIDFINQQLLFLDQQTMQIHDDLHETAIDVDDNTAALNAIKDSNYQTQINNLELSYLGLRTNVSNYENEIYLETNRINDKINDQTLQINMIENELNGEAEHVILSMTEFQQITPDNNKIYLVYL